MKLGPGICLAIEPMLTLGGHEVAIKPDGWTVVTRDGSLAAHFEHTIAVTDNGPEILTTIADDESRDVCEALTERRGGAPRVIRPR